jgi:hypothetical protein
MNGENPYSIYTGTPCYIRKWSDIHCLEGCVILNEKFENTKELGSCRAMVFNVSFNNSSFIQ